MEVRIRDLVPVLTPEEGAAAQQQSQQRLQRQQTLIDSRRALVLDAARAVFAEKGIEGASVREIAKRAGYTPGALYSYFDSKEAIYAALLEESLERLNAQVDAAREPKNEPRSLPQRLLGIKSQAWFAFFAENPRDLDLCFYLLQGLAPRGLTKDLNQQLSERLAAALRPCEDALLAMGQDAPAALRENTALLAHGVGLLLLHHTGRIRMFGQSAQELFDAYVEHLVQRLLPDAQALETANAQTDMFGKI